MNVSIDIIIVNWNAGIQLKHCIDSINPVKQNLDLRVIVVDNGSTDGSDLICDNAVDTVLLRTGSNLGFGKACNLGAAQGFSKYLLFLNPDAALFPHTLENAFGFMQDSANADVGICGVQLVDNFGKLSRSCARFPTSFGLMLHAVGIDRLFPRLGHPMLDWAHDSNRYVDHVIGAFFMVRRDVFESLGGFDEQFFVYLEDLDFSYRAYKAGWSSVYLADVQAFHSGGGTSDQVKARRLFYSLRSRLLYSVKHFSWFGSSLVICATLFVEPFSRSALAILRRSWPSLKETLHGYALLWSWLPKWLMNGVTR